MGYVGNAPGQSGNILRQVFLAGAGFTAGTSTTLTMANLPVATNNVDIYFNGVFQISDQWAVNLATGVITFTAPIPADVTEIEVLSVSTVSIGTPSPTTVTTASLAAGAALQIPATNLAPYAVEGATTDNWTFRNVLINGAMEIDQRNSGAAVTPPGFTYLVDRWQLSTNLASKITAQQVADAPPGFKNSLKLTVASQYSPAASDYSSIMQMVEGLNIISFAQGTASAQSMTISFWIKGSVAGTYAVTLRGATLAYVSTVAVTTSWAKQTVTVPGAVTGTWNVDNTVGVSLIFDTGSGTNFSTTAGAWQTGNYFRTAGSVTFVNQTAGATLNITGVQLEAGVVATPFEKRLYGVELALCQRYYYAIIPATNVVPIVMMANYTSTTAYGVLPLPVTMRAVPTGNVIGGATFGMLQNASSITTTAVSVGLSNQGQVEINAVVASGLVQGQASWLRSSATTNQIQLSAEL